MTNSDPLVEGFNRTEHLFMPEDHMEQVYSSKNPLVRFFHLGRLDAIVKEIPCRNLKVLDAGCGEGHLLKKLYESEPARQYYGVDITEVALEKARQRCPFAHLKKINLSQTGFSAGFFDVVISTEVLEHIYEYERVVNELKRILKTGGLLLVTFPNEVVWTAGRFLLGRRPIKVPDHVHSFSPKTMKAAIGLKPLKQINFPPALPFAFSTGSLMKFEKEGF